MSEEKMNMGASPKASESEHRPVLDGSVTVPWDAVERVAAELCRQRGWTWAEQGNDMRVALTTVAIQVLEAEHGRVSIKGNR